MYGIIIWVSPNSETFKTNSQGILIVIRMN